MEDPVYQNYSIEELEEVIQNIDKRKYKKRYEEALLELNDKREKLLLDPKTFDARGKNKEIIDLNKSRSLTRIVILLLVGFIISFSMTMGNQITPLKGGVDFLLSIVLISITGMPLILSIITGKTISRAGVINISDSYYHFSLMQLGWSVLFWISIIKTILRLQA